ncbi:hypothetical protein, partial [Sinorhizobium meliloti]|uniref:hypothetical protein n=3 Tax=Rhizobium meliloti TaxID=382 RepID=UPI0004274307
MTIHNRLKAAAINRFQQLGENARGEPHAPSPFLSLDNQKIDGKTPSDGACACDISIHPELSPDSPAFHGEKGLVALARNTATASAGRGVARLSLLPVRTGKKVPAGG